MTKYVTITTVSTHTMRYVMELPEGQTEAGLRDSVSSDEVDDISQEHLGESIIESREITEEEMLKLFPTYLQGWSKEKKLDWVSKCVHPILIG